MESGDKKGRVLIFSSREICYLSANFFANQLGAAFEELGYEADICEFTAEDDLDEKLKPYLGQRYEVIADFNSMLPRMVLEDGTPYLDRMDGPFFDYILDHPLFHYTGLSSGVKNLHALVLDEAQARYASACYPKLASVSMLPLGATKALGSGKQLPGATKEPGSGKQPPGATKEPGSGKQPPGATKEPGSGKQPPGAAKEPGSGKQPPGAAKEPGSGKLPGSPMKLSPGSACSDTVLPGLQKDAECRILFTATYDDPNEVYKVVQAAPEPLRSVMKQLVEMRVADPLLPMEEAFAQYLRTEGTELSAEEFALFMNAMYAVDAYIRNYFRKQVTDRLLAQKIPVTVMGSGWEKYRHPGERWLKREPEVVFGLSFERIARAHVLLNVAPIFNRGMHDRIPAGMANGAVVLTEKNPYLERQFTDGNELMFYSLTDLDTAAEAAERLIGDPVLRGEIALRAYREFEAHHTWRCRAESILALSRSGICDAEASEV